LLGYHGPAMSAWGLSTKRKALKERLCKSPKNAFVKKQIAIIDKKLKRMSDNATPIYISKEKHKKLQEWKELEHYSTFL